MECPQCGEGTIVGRFRVDLNIPLNRKGGGLNMAGQKVTQADVKNAWEQNSEDTKQIVCSNCGIEFEYLPGKGVVPKGDGAVGESEPPMPVKKNLFGGKANAGKPLFAPKPKVTLKVPAAAPKVAIKKPLFKLKG